MYIPSNQCLLSNNGIIAVAYIRSSGSPPVASTCNIVTSNDNKPIVKPLIIPTYVHIRVHELYIYAHIGMYVRVHMKLAHTCMRVRVCV